MQGFKVVYNIFVMCIAVIAVLLIISIFPITGNYKVLVVQSSSMEPAVKVGSLVVSKPASQYRVGEIITFEHDNMLITHRIFKMDMSRGKPVYITKGDANNGPDKNEISAEQIVGKVYLKVPYAGYVVDTAKRPWGFLILIIVPALLVIFDELKKIYQEIIKMRRLKKSSQQKSPAKKSALDATQNKGPNKRLTLLLLLTLLNCSLILGDLPTANSFTSNTEIASHNTIQMGIWGIIPQVRVISPNGGEEWWVGHTYEILWLATHPDIDDNDLKIDLYYSADSGASWGLIEQGTDNDGSYEWRVPLFLENGTYWVASPTARIKVVAYDLGYPEIYNEDISDEDYCPPIDYALLTPEELAWLEQMGLLPALNSLDILSPSHSSGGSAGNAAETQPVIKEEVEKVPTQGVGIPTENVGKDEDMEIDTPGELEENEQPVSDQEMIEEFDFTPLVIEEDLIELEPDLENATDEDGSLILPPTDESDAEEQMCYEEDINEDINLEENAPVGEEVENPPAGGEEEIVIEELIEEEPVLILDLQPVDQEINLPEPSLPEPIPQIQETALQLEP